MRPDLDFSHRSKMTELMDEPCTYDEFHDCLKDLSRVNELTLAYWPTLAWLERVVAAYPLSRPLRIVDIGCGYGDMLRRIDRWAVKRGIPVKLIGIDLNPYSARSAMEATAPGRHIEWLTQDAFAYQPEGGIDVIISSLFTHHLSDNHVVTFLQWMESTAKCGWFINDLYRGALPYHFFRLWSWAMRWHRFVQHDGPVSVTRSFLAQDWESLCAKAGLKVNKVTITFLLNFRLTVGRIKS